MSNQILNTLSANPGQWLTLRALEKATRLNPAQIQEQIHLIQTLGYSLESSPALGYRLATQTTGLVCDRIEQGLDIKRVGRKILVYHTTGSTNDVCWSYAEESAAPGPNYDGLAVFADHQRSGRGRQGRSWHSQPGNSLLCSILLLEQNRQPMLEPACLSLAAGISAAEAIETVCALPARIKWPNDVIIQNRKLAGVMVEARAIAAARAFVIGIGINCRQLSETLPPDLHTKAISIAELTSRPVDRERLGQVLLQRLDDWITRLTQKQPARQQAVNELHECWMTRCQNINQRLTLLNDGRQFTGRVIDVDIEKGLALLLDDGGIRFFDSATTTVKVD